MHERTLVGLLSLRAPRPRPLDRDQGAVYIYPHTHARNKHVDAGPRRAVLPITCGRCHATCAVRTAAKRSAALSPVRPSTSFRITINIHQRAALTRRGEYIN